METIDVISGLLTQKPGREPEIGQTKCFTVEKRVSEKTGKPWMKVKNSTPDKGGLNYRILNVQSTDFTDAHGNVSFNIELEAVPMNGQGGAATPSSTTSTHQPHQNTHSDPVGAAKGHLARAANAMLLCLEAARFVSVEWEARYGVAPPLEQQQAITSSFFINLDRTGLINGLPSAPPAKEGEQPF